MAHARQQHAGVVALQQAEGFGTFADLLGEAVETIPGPVTGLPIPANAEIAFEGYVSLDDLIDARLRRAEYLLKHVSLTAKQIAAECGFASPEHFHRLFRARRGYSPGQTILLWCFLMYI